MSATTLHVVERRIFPTEFREVPGSNGRQRWARAVTYGTVDDYGTTWLPGCFNDGLGARMPTILYGHDWTSLEHVLGQGVDFRDVRAADQYGGPGCDVLVEFADPEQVPSARLALVLTAPPNPILRDVSVGFDRQEWINKGDLPADLLAMGAEEAMVRALMDELSVVVRGAVPGASMRGKRSWVIDGKVTETDPAANKPAPRATEPEVRTVPVDDVINLARRVNSGEVSMEDARVSVSLLTAVPTAPDGDEQVGSLAGALDATLDEALACTDGLDLTTWPAEAQQMAALVQAAETVVDELLEVLGVPDPDDADGVVEAPAQLAAPEGEERTAEDEEPAPVAIDEAELAALVARAALRGR